MWRQNLFTVVFRSLRPGSITLPAQDVRDVPRRGVDPSWTAAPRIPPIAPIRFSVQAHQRSRLDGESGATGDSVSCCMILSGQLDAIAEAFMARRSDPRDSEATRRRAPSPGRRTSTLIVGQPQGLSPSSRVTRFSSRSNRSRPRCADPPTAGNRTQPTTKRTKVGPTCDSLPLSASNAGPILRLNQMSYWTLRARDTSSAHTRETCRQSEKPYGVCRLKARSDTGPRVK